jgi:adenylate kinase family enzyme
MKRICVIGSSGTGKSTLSRKLGERLGLPVIHLDTLYWRPGWTKPEDEETFREQVRQAAAGETWIIDGNFGSTLDVRLPRADTVILLERSRWLCLWRVIKRYFQWAGRTRPDLAEGCPEQIDLEFYRYVLSFPKTHADRTRAAVAEHGAHAQLIVLKSDRETEAFVERL